jgi:hypothetical protein
MTNFRAGADRAFRKPSPIDRSMGTSALHFGQMAIAESLLKTTTDVRKRTFPSADLKNIRCRHWQRGILSDSEGLQAFAELVILPQSGHKFVH